MNSQGGYFLGCRSFTWRLESWPDSLISVQKRCNAHRNTKGHLSTYVRKRRVKAIVRLPGFKTAPQLGRGNEWRYYVVYIIPDLPRLLRAKDEKRKSKDEGQTKIDGQRTKSKNQRRKSADKNCTTGPPYFRLKLFAAPVVRVRSIRGGACVYVRM